MHIRRRTRRERPAGNNIHFPFVFADLIDGFSGDAAVQGDEIDTVLGMEADDVNKIFGGQRIQVSLVMDHTVIYRHGADHGWTFGGQFPPERLRIAVARQVHDASAPILTAESTFCISTS